MPRPVTIGAGQPNRRAGVTLVELLVVMGIMLTLSTLGVVAFTRANRVNRLTATRDLVSDMARQARATARATARPVILRVEPLTDTTGTVTGAQLSGVTASPVIEEDFETPLVGGTTNQTKFRTALGSVGQGFVFSSDPIDPDPSTLERRGMLRTKDGFHLSVAVYPPKPDAGPQPLVMLATTATNDDAATSLAGLRLVPVTVPIYADTGAKLSDTAHSTWNPQSSAWMLQGWIRFGTAAPVLISEYLWPIDPTLDLWSMTPAIHDQARLTLMTDGGLRWEVLGLLWDGTHAVLLRNGRPVARRTITGSQTLAQSVEQHLIFGHATTPTGWIEDNDANPQRSITWSSGPTTITAGTTVLDHVYLDRLGLGDPHRLPNGVIIGAASPQELVFWPDGTVSPDLGRATGSDLLLKFTGVAEDQAATVTIPISSTTGAVRAITIQPRP